MKSLFRYNAEKSCLEEQPSKNRYTDFPCNEAGGQEMWEEYLASLRSIPTDFKDWPKGEDLLKEWDFKIENGKSVPIPPSQPKEESEEEMWKECFDTFWQEGSDGMKAKFKLTKKV